MENEENVIETDVETSQTDNSNEETATKETTTDVVVPESEPLTPTIIKPEEETKVSKFMVAVVQRDADTKQVIVKLSLSFELPKDREFDADLVLGTALDNLFSEMDLHKATKSKLFNARLPLELAITSEHVSMDLGKVSRTALSVMKVNNGERSKLLFIDRLIAIMNHAMQPMQQKRLSELRSDMVAATQLRYNLTTAPKGIVAPSAINKLARAKFIAVNEDGKLEKVEETTASN